MDIYIYIYTYVRIHIYTTSLKTSFKSPQNFFALRIRWQVAVGMAPVPANQFKYLLKNNIERIRKAVITTVPMALAPCPALGYRNAMGQIIP